MVFMPDPKPTPKEKKKPTALKRTPLKRSKEYKIPKESAKRKIENRTYSKLRKEYLEANPVCGFDGCQAIATDIHHKKSRGINLNNVNTWIGLCRNHHCVVHDQNIKL